MFAKRPETVTSPREFKASLAYILLGDLRDLLEEPASDATCTWLRAVLDALLETLPHGSDVEDEGDYLSEVLVRFPSWQLQVDRLLREHRTLYSNLRSLRDRIGQQKPFAEIAQQVRRELREWMNTMIAHHRHENRLLLTAMTLEVGSGD